MEQVQTYKNIFEQTKAVSYGGAMHSNTQFVMPDTSWNPQHQTHHFRMGWLNGQTEH
jgi:hypothetical protein